MKLHSPVFEKNLRRGVKARIRSSRELRREYRNAKKAVRRRSNLVWLFRPFWSCILGFIVVAITKGTGHVSSGLAIIGVWTLVHLSISALTLQAILFKAHDLPALFILPVSESVIFRWELGKFFRRIAIYALLDQFIAFGAVGLCLQFSFAQWLLAGFFAILSWAMLLALTGLCAARFPKFPYQKINAALFILGLGLIFANALIGNFLLKMIDTVAPVLNWVLPTAWVPSLLQLCLPGGHWMVLVLLVPVLLVLLSVKSSLFLLRARLQFKEKGATLVQVGTTESETDGLATPSSRAFGDEHESGNDAAIEAIRTSGQWRQYNPTGWLEKRVWDWLTPHEQTLVAFAFPKGLVLTRPWLNILRNGLIAIALGLIVGMADPFMEPWILGTGIFITFSQCLAQILSHGLAFRSYFCSGVLLPIYAVYPITFSDLSRTLFKVAVFQLPLFVIYTMIAGAIIAPFLTFDHITGAIMGFRAGTLIFAGRYIVTVLAFSSLSNDTSKFRLRSISLVMLFLCGGCLFLALGAIGCFAQHPLWSWASWLVAIIDAYALFRIYGGFYNSGRFDLMSLPRR